MREDLERASKVGGFVGPLKKALAAAEAELAADETVNAAGSVNLDGKACAAVATNRRLLFVSAGLFRTSTSSVTLPVAGVDHARGKITLHTAGGERTFKVASGGKELEQAILDPSGGPVKTWREASQERTPKGVEHPLVKKPLEELAAMLDAGKISAEEYAERRAKVLARVASWGM
jgi:hypothetical protein